MRMLQSTPYSLESRIHWGSQTAHLAVQRMRDMDVNFIDVDDDGVKDFSKVASGDVVILPAFGASVQVRPHRAAQLPAPCHIDMSDFSGLQARDMRSSFHDVE
jgi:hypothetical protein